MHLETTFCIDMLREAVRGPGPASRMLERLADTEVFVSVFVACELQAGARMSRRPETEVRNIERLLEQLTIVYPDEVFAAAYGEAEAAIRRQGVPIPTMDLLIGVMARRSGQPLLTRDVRHYRQIPGLTVETY